MDEFCGSVQAAVGSNAEVTNSEELNYVKACVKGDAARLSTSIGITDHNYLITKDMLTERSANKRNNV